MRKLLGKSSAPSSTSRRASSGAGEATPVSSAWRPAQAQDGVYHAGAPISCFDVAPDGRAAVLAGPHVLKTVLLKGDGSGFNAGDGVNLRAAITTRQSGGTASSGFVADQLNIGHVKWQDHATVFTACASGNIFAYDLTRIGPAFSGPLECIQTHEDSRQVNSLDVNPHRRSWLLSGSQDGVTRVFDTSMPHPTRSGALAFRQRFPPLRCIDSVRQVQWSPTRGTELVCCTDGGVVLKWDVRQASRPLLRINAHDKACSAVAWHPDGIHLISAGWDAKLNVWEVGATADKRQRPKWTLAMPAPVSAVAWRPPLWSATAQSRRIAQVAVSYDESGKNGYGLPVVHVWDLARPTLPYKQLERFDKAPSYLMWQGQDMLWTVGHDGLFNQCDVAFAPKVLDRLSTSAMAFSPTGDAMVFLDTRSQPQRSRQHTITQDTETMHRKAAYASSQNLAGLSVSRSDSDEDVMATFLASRRETGDKDPPPSAKSGALMSTTPPSGLLSLDDRTQALNLEQSIGVTGLYWSQQTMVSGHIPWAKSPQLYEHMSSAYLEILDQHLPYTEGGKPLVDRVGNIMEQYARTAEGANLYRLAQTWRILAYAMTLLLRRRAQYHVESRAAQLAKLSRIESSINVRAKVLEAPAASSLGDSSGAGEATPRPPPLAHKASVEGRLAARSLLSEELESTSNVATPIARPADTSRLGTAEQLQYSKRLGPIIEPDRLNLGPAAHGAFEQKADGGDEGVKMGGDDSTDKEPLRQVSSTEGYDFYDTEGLVKAIDVPRTRAGGAKGQSGRHMLRQDSEESYAQLFSISEGNKQFGVQSSSSASDDAFAKPTMMRHLSDTDKSSMASSVDDGQAAAAPLRRLATHPESPAESHADTEKSRAHEPGDDLTPQATVQSGDSSQPSAMSEASGSRKEGVVEAHASSETTTAAEPSRGAASTTTATKPGPSRPRLQITDDDYLPWSDDAPYPYPLQTDPPAPNAPPLDPYATVTRALNFETRTSALHASAMVLLLKPLVPADVICTAQASGILRQHHARLMTMRLFIPAALLRKLCVTGHPAGMPTWGETYAPVVAPAQLHTKIAFACPACCRAREPDPALGDRRVWVCEHCGEAMAPCAVCGHRDAQMLDDAQMLGGQERAGGGGAGGAQILGGAQVLGGAQTLGGAQVLDDKQMLDDAQMLNGQGRAGGGALWWWCPACGHGGHAGCMAAWQAESTCCPVEGCVHLCLEEDKDDEDDEDKAPKRPGRRAVGRAGRAATGVPGRGESRKSVKFARR